VSLHELESAVNQLPADELATFARWFEEYLADAWDRRIEADVKAGRLDEAGRRADADFEAGRCDPLRTTSPRPISGTATVVCLRKCENWRIKTSPYCDIMRIIRRCG
jgi:hypothetical protein